MPDPDPLDWLVDEVRQQRLPEPFLAADVIRRRSRHRGYRQAALAGVAVLAVTGLVAGGLAVAAGPTDAPPPPAQSRAAPTQSASPPAETPPEIPPEWFLTTEDLGPGPWDSPLVDEYPASTNGLPWICNGPPPPGIDGYPSIRHQLNQVRVEWHQTGGGTLAVVVELVERYESGWGPAVLDDIRTGLVRCSERDTPFGDPVLLYTIIDEGFAGDESLLVYRELHPSERATDPALWLHGYIAVVRVGDVVRTVQRPYLEARSEEAAGYVRELAQRAVDRL